MKFHEVQERRQTKGLVELEVPGAQGAENSCHRMELILKEVAKTECQVNRHKHHQVVAKKIEAL